METCFSFFWKDKFQVMLICLEAQMRIPTLQRLPLIACSELFKELSRYPYIGTFQSYEKSLRYWDSEQVLKLYTEILKIEMDRACNRKQYHYVAPHLSMLWEYPNGREEARALAAYWHIYHKNRPAMKDELKKAGYPQD